MDLRSYQQQMGIALKKYLNLISLKQDQLNLKTVEKEYFDLLKEIIGINEKQKTVILAMRSNRVAVNPNLKNKKASLDQYVSDANISTVLGREGSENHPLDEECKPLESRVKMEYLSMNENNLEGPAHGIQYAEELVQEVATPGFEDIHDLVTANEFTQSLGLLTIKECEEVLKKRQERHERNAISHIFCPAIWEKQETKRKKRDWLLSSSPPQLRRKSRPASHPPSRQPSRPTSPLGGGASSSPSSLSPPSPISPGSFSRNSQSTEEICSICKKKGASFQCDGCGVLFHTTCVDCPDEEPEFLSEWLCRKCERLGLRASSAYRDPLHKKLNREELTKKEHLTVRADLFRTPKKSQESKILCDKKLKELKKEKNIFEKRKRKASDCGVSRPPTAAAVSPDAFPQPAVDRSTEALIMNPPKSSVAPSSVITTSPSSVPRTRTRGSGDANASRPTLGNHSLRSGRPVRSLLPPPAAPLPLHATTLSPPTTPLPPHITTLNPPLTTTPLPPILKPSNVISSPIFSTPLPPRIKVSRQTPGQGVNRGLDLEAEARLCPGSKRQDYLPIQNQAFPHTNLSRLALEVNRRSGQGNCVRLRKFYRLNSLSESFPGAPSSKGGVSSRLAPRATVEIDLTN